MAQLINLFILIDLKKKTNNFFENTPLGHVLTAQWVNLDYESSSMDSHFWRLPTLPYSFHHNICYFFFTGFFPSPPATTTFNFVVVVVVAFVGDNETYCCCGCRFSRWSLNQTCFAYSCRFAWYSRVGWHRRRWTIFFTVSQILFYLYTL